MKKALIYILLVMPSCLFCCKKPNPSDGIRQDVEAALVESGNNRTELIKVINYYKRQGDSLKLRACYYLIANMISQYHYEGPGIDKYRETFNIMDSLLQSGNGIFDRSWDSIQKIHPPPGLKTVRKVKDIRTIRADFLIKNIEASFKAWHYPWAKALNFDDFCETILPYKVANEAFEDWKDTIQAQYKWVLDSIKNHRDLREACLIINNDLKKKFYINAKFKCNWDVNYYDLIKLKTGRCTQATQLTAYVMRAMGLPVMMESTPFWANRDGGHEWNSFYDHGKLLFFVGTESDPGKNKIMFTRSEWIKRKSAKIYRATYAEEPQSLGFLTDGTDEIPGFLIDSRAKDVTEQYVPTADVSLRLNGSVRNARYAYICVFNNEEWRPIHWAKVGLFDRVTFSKMGTDILYIPMYFKNSKLIPAGQPFVLDRSGKQESVSSDTTERSLAVIRQKYPQDKSNYIFPNMNYELFYWNDFVWSSLGRKKATSDSLSFTNVPKGALLWIRNLDKGKQERIFTYKNNKQVWW